MRKAEREPHGASAGRRQPCLCHSNAHNRATPVTASGLDDGFGGCGIWRPELTKGASVEGSRKCRVGCRAFDFEGYRKSDKGRQADEVTRRGCIAVIGTRLTVAVST